jgi:hypothetical protein
MPDRRYEGNERGDPERMGQTDAASDSVLRGAMLREVAGVLPSRIALEASVESLLLAGFDRADMDFVGWRAPASEQLGTADFVPKDDVDLPQSLRRPSIAADDAVTTEVVVAGLLASIAGIAAGFIVVSSGAAFGLALMVSVAAALFAGGLGFLLTMLFLRLKVRETHALEAATAPPSFVLWVRVRAPEQEDAAKHILKGYGGRSVRLHEIENINDIPLRSLRPVPWLGAEWLDDR